MKSVLFYNLFPKTIWKEVTNSILSNTPHDSIVIHVTMPWYKWIFYPTIITFLKKFTKVEAIYFSCNKRNRGESLGFNKFRKNFDFSNYSIVTYTHSKGTSKKKKNTQAIADWTELMRYFVIERLDLCQEAFAQGKLLYGVNLNNKIASGEKYKGLESNFIYEGNFVSLNLEKLREEFLNTQCYKSYYGVERFWGNTTSYENAYSAYESGVNHYNDTLPPHTYQK